MKQLLFLFVSLYIFSACNTPSKSTKNTSSIAYKYFLENKKLWEKRQIQNYSFVVQKSCFCPYREKIHIIVHNAKVTEAKYIPSNSAVDMNTKQKTIDQYFDIIEEALDENAYELTVTYDENYGYPKEISIDYDQQMVDEEMYYTLTHFTPIVNGGIVCTQEYAPVCAKVNMQCVTQPCESIEQTFSNKCMLNANPNATYIKDGEC